MNEEPDLVLGNIGFKLEGSPLTVAFQLPLGPVLTQNFLHSTLANSGSRTWVMSLAIVIITVR